MSPSPEVHVSVGVVALALGLGALLRIPHQGRSRLFAALCAALAAWNLGRAASAAGLGGPGAPWQLLYLLGACAAPPVGLHFAVALAGRTRARALAVAGAYAAALVLWLLAWTPVRDRARTAWNVAALTLLSVVVVATIGLLLRHVRAQPRGPARRAYRLLLFTSLLAAAGGLSDLIPRQAGGTPRLGALALLPFLLVLCGILVRYRFLDVNAFVVRSAAHVVGATIAALAIQAVARLSDSAFVPLLLVSLAVLLVAGPGREMALSGVRAALAPRDPVARVLASASGRLAVAQSAAEVWSIVDETCRRLPGDTRIHVLHADSPGSAFRDVFRSEGLAPRPEVAPGADLPALLDAERAPATRRYLEAEAASGPARARARARAACGELEASGADLVVPLLGGGALSGWIAVSGLPEEHVTAEVGAAFMAVAHQASANLERMAALEVARRREALAAVGEMAAGLAHEVRNPLAAIRGAVQVMAAAPDPERRREMIQVAEEETERLARVVGEFLDYARPGVTRREPVDLGEIARRVLRASDVAGRGLVADVRVAPGAPPALADPDQVERAFRNLVQNAADAAGPSGRLRIEILPGEAGAVAARFEDDGPGIAAEIMPKLFQPFCTGKPGGVGLGLALVHRVAEAHGGSVAVEPPRGRGACFVLTLPAAGGVAP